MSYNDFSSNPNNFGATAGNTGTRRTDQQWSDPTAAATADQQSFGTGAATVGSDLTTQGTTWDRNQGGDWQTQQSGLRDPYKGNTTDINTPGTGGNFTGRSAGVGRDVDQQFEARQPIHTDNRTSQANAFENDDRFNEQPTSGNQQASGTGKPGIGDRLKGSMEKAAGRVAGNPAMVERGEERRAGDQWNTGSQH